jgi:hypothetical protein
MSESDGSGSCELPNERCDPPLWIDDTGDYRYLREAYYRSLDSALCGRQLLPSSLDALDAFLTPLTLLKASLAGIPVPPHRLVDDAFSVTPPALVLAINAFQAKYRVVNDSQTLAAVVAELSHRHSAPVVIETLAAGDTVREFLAFKGEARAESDRALAARFFSVFHVPMAKLVVIEGEAGMRLAAALPVLHARKLPSAAPAPTAIADKHAPRLVAPARAATRAARMQ